MQTEMPAMGEAADAQYISRSRLSKILFDQSYAAAFDAKNMVDVTEEKSAVPVIAVVSGAAAVLLIAGISLKKRKAKKETVSEKA